MVKSPRRIAFIAGQLVLGGAEQQLYYLLSGIDRSRFEPVVITLGSSEDEYWEGPVRDLNVPLWRVPRDIGRIGRVFRIADILREVGAQVVHAWVFHTNPYAAIAGRMANVPLRVGSMRESYKGLPNDRFLRWIGCRGLDILVANAVQTAAEINKLNLTRAEVKVVPNGTRVPETLTELDRLRLKEELGYQASDLLIGTIGRLDSNKNQAMLIRAFAPLVTDWPKLRLLIIGDGPLRSELQTLAAVLGVSANVRLPGRMPEAARYLPSLEACCLTSHTEGMPNLVMEAGAAGLPVVSTRCGDVADLIDDQITGFLVDRDDDASMSDRLRFLLSTPEGRAKMGCLAREKIGAEFSLSMMISRMSALYEKSGMSASVS